MIAVCLRSVRLEVRTREAARLAKFEAREEARRELLQAAVMPSDRVYFVSEDARPIWEEVLSWDVAA